MDLEYKKFYLKRKKTNIIIDLIIAGIWIFTVVRSFISTKMHTRVSLTILILSSILIVGLLYYDIFKDYMLKKKQISDFSINDEDIVIPNGLFLNPKRFLIKDIIEIKIPKWDDIIQISFIDRSRIKLNLYYYSEKDKTELKGIFTNIKGVPLKSEKQEDISKKTIPSFHIINGKKYQK